MSPAQESIVMAFGALLTLAGVGLLLFRKAEGRNVMKAFGAEFELSTPALVVFIVGAGLFVAPFLMPRPPAADLAPPNASASPAVLPSLGQSPFATPGAVPNQMAPPNQIAPPPSPRKF